MGAIRRFNDLDDLVEYMASSYGLDQSPTFLGCQSCGGDRTIRYAEVGPGWVADSFMGPRVVAVCRVCGWRHDEEIECD